MSESHGPDELRNASRSYERPNVQSYSARQLIEQLGPAMAVYGDPTGGTSP